MLQNISPGVLGALRGLGAVILIVILQYLGEATNLTFLNNPTIEGIIVVIAGYFEHAFEAKKGTALFGAVKKKE